MATPETKVELRADSELMKNQHHGVEIGTPKDFQVLRTADEDAIFFSIGSDDIFYVTREIQRSSDWIRTDMSSSLRGKIGDEGKAKSFVVSQNPVTLVIDLALVMTIKGNDLLYLSRNNPASTENWAHGVTWTSVPFKSDSPAPSPFTIADMYMLSKVDEDGLELLTWFVDIVKSPGSAFKTIERYYIQPVADTMEWQNHPLPHEVTAGSISSCLGRREDDIVDGIYTLGKIGQSQSLVFTPMRNPWDPDLPPASARLQVPPGTTAISSCATEHRLTNLFVAGDGGLYCYKADQQKEGAQPSLIIPSSPVCNTNTFAKATCLRSITIGSQTAVWGLNDQGQLLYATCPAGQENECKKWSPPIQIASDVDQFAFYLNQKTTTNVIFALNSDLNMTQLVQDAEKSTWIKRSITLPPTNVDQMIEVMTFTTHVKCTDKMGSPAYGAPVTISSEQGAPLRINNVYRKLNPGSPIEIKADGTGSITIVQETESLSAICFTLSSGDQTLQVDPHSNIALRLSEIKSGNDLSNVRITDLEGNEKPLVPSDVSEYNRKAIAECVPRLLEMRSNLPIDGSRDTTALTKDNGEADLWGVVSDANQLHFYEGKDLELRKLGSSVGPEGYATFCSASLATRSTLIELVTSAADLFSFLKSTWDDVQAFFVKPLQGVYQFIVHVGDKIYTAILDCVSAVSSAIEFIFKKIKVFFQDLVAWLGFIFNWRDILRTHRVMKNIFKQYARNAVDQIDVLRVSLQDGFDQLQAFINGKSWEGLQDPGKSIGDTQQEMTKDISGADSPQSNWAVHHTINGIPKLATGAYVFGILPGVDTGAIEKLLGILESAVKDEEKVLKQAAQQIKDDVISQTHSLSLIQMIQKILSILATFLMGTAENVVLKLVDLIKYFMSSVLDLFDTPLEIPVISPLYKKITNGDLLSCMDLTCLIAAIPGTLIYKVATNETPFLDNPATDSLIKASSFSELSRLLSQPNKSSVSSKVSGSVTAAQLPSLAKTVVGVLKMCIFGVTAVKVVLETVKRESKISGAPVTALSFGLLIASSSPTIASNFVSVGKWTIVADVLAWVNLGKFCLDNSGLLDSVLQDYVAPWTTCLLGLTGLVTTIWGIAEKEKPKTSEGFGVLSGYYSNIAAIMTPFTSLKMFPETAPVIFVVAMCCVQLGGISSTISGKLSLQE